MNRGGKAALFERLEPFLFGATGEADYDSVGESLGMSRGAVAMAVKRMRERFGDIVTEEVARTLPDGADVKEELSYLLSVFAKDR